MNSFEELTYFEKFKNKKCDVLGFGTSNKPLVKLLLNIGAYVTVRDKNINALSSVNKDEYMGASFILGENYLDDIKGDYIFRSPGFRPDVKNIADAVNRGSILTSEMEEFFNSTPANIFAITGSDGKTTTTTLTHLFMAAQCEKSKCGRAFVGGNIGTPLLPLVNDMTHDDVAVVELSSFQLMGKKFSPLRALITNITPNHLNWHIDMDEYINAKENILITDYAVFNADNEITKSIGDKFTGHTVYFSSSRHDYFSVVPKHKQDNSLVVYVHDGNIVVADKENENIIIKVSDIKLPGVHNLENYMAAIGLTYGLVDNDVIENIAKTFNGVRHRLELVRELDGVKYYNSSIDSSPTRTHAAMNALDGDIIVICGGYDKNIPFDTLADTLYDRAKTVVLTGGTMDKIYDEIIKAESRYNKKLHVIREFDFERAVMAAHNEAKCGYKVLLSPACASFDAFKNFEERGDRFCEIVNRL